MAHRATGFAKKPPTAAAHVRATPQAAFVASAPPRPIPLALGPVVAPYKKHGRLSLRIERMPQLARLSRGRNNGNGSWSLGLDELEDLAFLPPDGMEGVQKLAIRVIGLDGGDGETLAVVDFPVSPRETPADSVASSDALKQLQRLHNELSETKRALDEREAELQRARRETADAEIEKARLDVEKALTDARIAWRRETDDELAVTLENAERRVAATREAERRDARDALTKAEAGWKATEAVRLAEAETRWLVQARSAETDTKHHDEAVRALQGDLELARNALDQQKAATAVADAKAKEEQQRVKAEAEDLSQQIARLIARNEMIQADLVAQRNTSAQAESERTQQIEAFKKLLAAMTARYDAAQVSLTELQNTPQQADLDTARRLEELTRQLADLTARPAPQVDVPDVETILFKARQAWTNEEAVRLAAAKSAWQTENTALFRETSARCETAEATFGALRATIELGGEEVIHLQAEIAQLQETLAERDNELAYARATLGMRSGLATDLAIEMANRPRVDPNAEERARATRKLLRDIGIAASFAVVVFMAVVVGLPRLIPLLPYDTQVAVIGIGQSIGLYSASASVTAPAPRPKKSAAALASASTTRSAKLRSKPTSKGVVVASLPRGTTVILLDTKAGWTHVKLADASEGWLFSAYLKSGNPK